MFAFLRSSGSRSVTAQIEAQVAISAILAALWYPSLYSALRFSRTCLGSLELDSWVRNVAWPIPSLHLETMMIFPPSLRAHFPLSRAFCDW